MNWVLRVDYPRTWMDLERADDLRVLASENTTKNGGVTLRLPRWRRARKRHLRANTILFVGDVWSELAHPAGANAKVCDPVPTAVQQFCITDRSERTTVRVVPSIASSVEERRYRGDTFSIGDRRRPRQPIANVHTCYVRERRYWIILVSFTSTKAETVRNQQHNLGDSGLSDLHGPSLARVETQTRP